MDLAGTTISRMTGSVWPEPLLIGVAHNHAAEMRSTPPAAIVPADATLTASALCSLIRHNPPSWRSLDAIHCRNLETGPSHRPRRSRRGTALALWRKSAGRVTFTADGRMMSVVCDGRKELPAGVSREYSSYCGNYTYDGEKLVTRVDAASDPSRIGGDQVRGVRFEGGARMVLIPRRAGSAKARNTARSPGSASRWNRVANLQHRR